MWSEESNKTLRKTLSQTLSYRFEIIFGKNKDGPLQKAKRWADRQPPPMNEVYLLFVKWFTEWYYDIKIELAMKDIDEQVEIIREKYGSSLPEPEVTSEPSEVEGLDEIRSTYRWKGDGDWHQ